MSCSLDNLSWPAWSDETRWRGDRGENSDVTGEIGGKLDSSSTKDDWHLQ